MLAVLNDWNEHTHWPFAIGKPISSVPDVAYCIFCNYCFVQLMVLDKGRPHKFFITNCILCNNSFNSPKKPFKISKFFGILTSKARVPPLAFLKPSLDESHDCLGHFYHLNRKTVKETNNSFSKVFRFVTSAFSSHIQNRFTSSKESGSLINVAKKCVFLK